MTTPSPDRPPLTTLDASGIYVLRLCKPKPEKFKTNTAGFPSVSVFFMTAEGLCFNKNYSTQYRKSYTDKKTQQEVNYYEAEMLVGRFTNKFIKPVEKYYLETFTDLINSAANCVAEVDLEVTPNGEWNGRPQFKYKFKLIKSILGNTNGQPTLNAEAPQVPDFSKPSESNPF